MTRNRRSHPLRRSLPHIIDFTNCSPLDIAKSLARSLRLAPARSIKTSRTNGTQALSHTC